MDDEIKYYLVKVLPSAKTITSNYGDLELDDELRRVIEKALAPILEKRLHHGEDSK